MRIEYEIKKCHCCFPFECGHRKIIINNWNYELLLMALKYSRIVEKSQLEEQPCSEDRE